MKAEAPDIAAFEDAVPEAIQAVRGALTELLVTAGADPERPQAVARRFGLNKNLAWKVCKIINSPDLYAYYVNRELFYDVTIWCTVIYFAFAWWDLQRSKSMTRSDEPSAEPAPAE